MILNGSANGNINFYLFFWDSMLKTSYAVFTTGITTSTVTKDML